MPGALGGRPVKHKGQEAIVVTAPKWIMLNKGGAPLALHVSNVFSVRPEHPSKGGCLIASTQGSEVQVKDDYEDVMKLIRGEVQVVD